MKRTCIQCGKEFELSQSEITFYRKKKLSLPKRCKECRELNKKKKNGKKSQNENYQQKEERKQEEASSASKADETLKYQQPQRQAEQPTKIQEISDAKKKKMGGKQRLAYIAAAILLGFGGGGAALSSMNDAEPTQPAVIEQTVEMEETAVTGEADVTEEFAVTEETDAAEEAAQDENSQKIEITYKFRNEELWENHYKKHGIEMGFDSKEAYLEGANRVIASPDVLQKIEAEDGDYIYYLEETNEFVVVAKKDGYLRTYFNPSRGMEYFEDQ